MWPLASRSLGWIRPKSAVTTSCQYVVAAQGPLRVHSTSNTAFKNDGQTVPTSHPSKTGTGQAGRLKGWHMPQPLGTEREGKQVIWLHGSPAANTWAHQPWGCKATGGTAPPEPRCDSPWSTDYARQAGASATLGEKPVWKEGNAARLACVTFFP